jgi:hypothetical protein
LWCRGGLPGVSRTRLLGLSGSVTWVLETVQDFPGSLIPETGMGTAEGLIDTSVVVGLPGVSRTRLLGLCSTGRCNTGLLERA